MSLDNWIPIGFGDIEVELEEMDSFPCSFDGGHILRSTSPSYSATRARLQISAWGLLSGKPRPMLGYFMNNSSHNVNAWINESAAVHISYWRIRIQADNVSIIFSPLLLKMLTLYKIIYPWLPPTGLFHLGSNANGIQYSLSIALLAVLPSPLSPPLNSSTSRSHCHHPFLRSAHSLASIKVM